MSLYLALGAMYVIATVTTNDFITKVTDTKREQQWSNSLLAVAFPVAAAIVLVGWPVSLVLRIAKRIKERA